MVLDSHSDLSDAKIDYPKENGSSENDTVYVYEVIALVHTSTLCCSKFCQKMRCMNLRVSPIRTLRFLYCLVNTVELLRKADLRLQESLIEFAQRKRIVLNDFEAWWKLCSNS